MFTLGIGRVACAGTFDAVALNGKTARRGPANPAIALLDVVNLVVLVKKGRLEKPRRPFFNPFRFKPLAESQCASTASYNFQFVPRTEHGTTMEASFLSVAWWLRN